jgi:hypothetical protein
MVLCGCRVQQQLANGPVYFTDADSGRTVAPVLIIPHYSVYSGMSKRRTPPASSSKGKSWRKFANPFIYHSDGAPFKVEQPLSTTIIIPPFVSILHRVILFNGVDVYAKGYEVKYVAFRFLIKPRPQTFKLKPLGENESEERFARISDGLRNKNWEWLQTYSWIPAGTVIKFYFTKKEFTMMQDFFAADAKKE